MKSFFILTRVLVQALAQALVITLIISACGAPQATPTPIGNAVEMQNTISAAAFTIVAETQAAIPTTTPPPPTATVTAAHTPAATTTLPAMPTLGATFTALPVVNAGTGDPCITTVLPASLEGETIKIRIDNPIKATLMVSVNLHQAGPQSACGYRGYTLAPGQSLVINDLVVGCYTIWAWNPDPDAYFIVTNGTSCLNTSRSWTFDISTGSIKLRP